MQEARDASAMQEMQEARGKRGKMQEEAGSSKGTGCARGLPTKGISGALCGGERQRLTGGRTWCDNIRAAGQPCAPPPILVLNMFVY